MARKKETYETKLSKLEGILQEMESDEISLEDSLKKYEEGIKLYRELYKTLEVAEGKIKILSENKEEEDFPELDQE